MNVPVFKGSPQTEKCGVKYTYTTTTPNGSIRMFSNHLFHLTEEGYMLFSKKAYGFLLLGVSALFFSTQAFSPTNAGDLSLTLPEINSKPLALENPDVSDLAEPVQVCMANSSLPLYTILPTATPDKPIGRTIGAAILLPIGLAFDILGVVFIAAGASANDGAEGAAAVGAVVGGVFLVPGIGCTIPGIVLLVKAIKGWKAVKAGSADGKRHNVNGVDLVFEF